MDAILCLYKTVTICFTNTIFINISILLLHNKAFLNEKIKLVFVFHNMLAVPFHSNTMLLIVIALNKHNCSV